MVATLIAMTPNRAMPRTISIGAMRSEGAIGPARDASSCWNWALIDCDLAISFLEALLPDVSDLRFAAWQTVTIGLAALGVSPSSLDNKTMSPDESKTEIVE